MVKKMLRLLGLGKKKKERKGSRVVLLEDASRFGNVDGAPNDAPNELDTAPSQSDVSRQDSDSASTATAARSPDDEKSTVTTIPTPPLPKKSYWHETAMKLQSDDPKTYKLLKKLKKHPSPDPTSSNDNLSKLINAHIRIRGDGQQSSFYKPTSEETKHRLHLQNYQRLRHIYVDYALTIDTLGQECANIPFAALNAIESASLYAWESHIPLLAGVAKNALMIAGYADIEALYHQDPATDLHPAFATALIDFYTSILTYQLKAAASSDCFLRRRFGGRLRRLRRLLSSKSDIEQGTTDWPALQHAIGEKGAVCQNLQSVFVSPDPLVAGMRLSGVLETFGEKRAGAVGRAEGDVPLNPPTYDTAPRHPVPMSIWEQTLASL